MRVLHRHQVLAPDDVVAPDNVVAPDDVIAPDDVVAPHDVVVAEAVAPDDVVAPDNVVAPHDAVAPHAVEAPNREVVVERLAPHDVVAPHDVAGPRVSLAANRRLRLNRNPLALEVGDVRPDPADQLDAAAGVDVAGALAQRAVGVAGVVLHRDGGELQDTLREVRRERRHRLLEQSDHAGRDARGHAGAGQLQELLARVASLHELRVALDERAGRCRHRNQHVPRRNDIGLDETVVPRRAARAVDRHAVVVARNRVVVIGGADRNRRGRVAGRGDTGKSQVALIVDAVVAGRGHDDDARLRRPLHGLHERIARGRFVNRMAERQVDDVDAEESLVRNRELNRADDVAGLAAAVLVEHLQPDELHRRGDALVLHVTESLEAADQARDVRPMTVVVEGGSPHAALGEIVKRLDSVAERRRGMNARVDQGNRDALAAGRIRAESQRAEQGAGLGGAKN